MSPRFIDDLVRKLERTSIVLCEYEASGISIRLTFARNDATEMVTPIAGSLETSGAGATTSTVISPRVGIYLSTHPLEASPLVVPGQPVRKDQAVGFVKVNELLFPVTSPCNGIYREQLVSDGALVGYGADLLLIEAAIGS